MKNKIVLFFSSCALTFSAMTFALDIPTKNFTNNNDGTATDNKTGLTWQRCVVGQSWTGSTCTGEASFFPFDQAVALTSNFAGKNDWRLARIDELNSLIPVSANDSYLFPNPPNMDDHNNPFWTASSSISDFNNAWYKYGSGSAFDDYSDKGSFFAARLVRGGQPLNKLGEYTPTTDFIDNKDGTVTHKKTNLMWQRCAIGQISTETACSGLTSKMNYDYAMKQTSTLGGFNDWRVPTIYELATIVEYSKKDLAANTVIFPDTGDSRFWSSSTSSSKDAYFIYNDGGVSDHYKSNNLSVRLVRGEQSPQIIETPTIPVSVDLNAKLSALSTQTKVNQDFTFTATVSNNGTGNASDVKLRFSLPSTIKFISTSNSDCVFQGLGVTCSIDNLTAKTSESRSITIKIAKAGGVSFAATVKSAEIDTKPEDNRVAIVVAIKK